MKSKQLNRINKLFLLALIGPASASFTSAQIAAGGNYSLEQSVIASGGGTAADSGGGAFSVTGTIGQAVAGTTGANPPFVLRSGFFTPQALAPTAAGVIISGRARRAFGKAGIGNAVITLTETDGTTHTTLSDSSGEYIFTGIAAGQTIILSALSRQYSFSQPTQVIYLTEEAGDIDFIAVEQFIPIEIIPKEQ